MGEDAGRRRFEELDRRANRKTDIGKERFWKSERGAAEPLAKQATERRAAEQRSLAVAEKNGRLRPDEALKKCGTRWKSMEKFARLSGAYYFVLTDPSGRKTGTLYYYYSNDGRTLDRFYVSLDEPARSFEDAVRKVGLDPSRGKWRTYDGRGSQVCTRARPITPLKTGRRRAAVYVNVDLQTIQVNSS